VVDGDEVKAKEDEYSVDKFLAVRTPAVSCRAVPSLAPV
jgi:hypothetical protein